VTRSLSIFTERRVAAVVALSALLLTTSCGDKVLQGRGASYLIVSLLQAASGAKSATFSTFLESDVVTNVKGTGTTLVPTVYEDMGQVALSMAMKDPVTVFEPTATNTITVERYHVDYVRTDGRNTQGVDVPYSFDGAVTGTITSTGTTLVFVLVRAQAKLEAPLLALRGLGGAVIISTLAQVTFYGHDQAGNAVSVSGTISINFSDWGDPA
jgi:hypothetical protein